MNNEKCFIITHIGKSNSKERNDSDDKFFNFFKPVLDNLGYDAIKANEEDIPGRISETISLGLEQGDLAIADISFLNPNVFYEIGIWNALKKPIIVFKLPNQNPPFDIQDKNCIDIKRNASRSWEEEKKFLQNISSLLNSSLIERQNPLPLKFLFCNPLKKLKTREVK